MFVLLPAPALAQTLPPRTVSDILGVLDAHKPAPEVLRKAREAATVEPPKTDDHYLGTATEIAFESFEGELHQLLKRGSV